MNINHEDKEALSILTLRGDFTREFATPFRDCVQSRLLRDVRDFVLDMSDVEFIDSVGLEALLWLKASATEHLGEVRLACVHENVKSILHVTRLKEELVAHDDLQTAVSSLRI